MGKVLYGIRNVYVAKLTENEGVITYGTPFAVEGATGFSPEPQGENILTQILGRNKDSNGVLVENAEDKMSRFALMFEAEGAPKNRRFVYWDVTATRPSREFNTTEDSIEVGTESLTLTIAPRSTDNAVGGYIELTDDNTEVYNAWFSSVYESNISL